MLTIIKNILNIILFFLIIFTASCNNKEKLFLYISENNVTALQKALSDDVNVNVARENGFTLLMFAVFHGKIKIVNLLLQAGADVNQIDNNGFSALMYAAKSYSKNRNVIIKILLKMKASIDLINKKGESAFMIALKNNKVSTALLLLKHNANPKGYMSNGFTPLCLAIHTGYKDIAHHVINKKVDINVAIQNETYKGYTPLIFSIEKNSNLLTKKLIQAGAYINVFTVSQKLENFGFTPIMFAISKDNYALVRYLVTHGAQINYQVSYKNRRKGLTPLMLASLEGNLKIVKLLVLNGAKINTRVRDWFSGELLYHQSALFYAAFKGNTDVVKYLIEKGADINIKVITENILMAAVQGSHYETVKYILTVGININEKTKYAREESVLDMARSRKDVKMIRLLKKAGAK